MIRAMYLARMEDSKGTYNFLVGRPEGKRSLGKPRFRWDDNIKTDLKKCMGYVNLAENRDRWQDRVFAIMSLLFP